MRYLKPFKDALGVTRTPGDLVPNNLPGTAAAHYEKHGMIGDMDDDDALAEAADKRTEAADKAAGKDKAARDSVVKEAQSIAKGNRKIGAGVDPLADDDPEGDPVLDPEEEYERLDEIADKARDKARRYERKIEKEDDPEKLEALQAKFETAKEESIKTRAAADAAKPQ